MGRLLCGEIVIQAVKLERRAEGREGERGRGMVEVLIGLTAAEEFIKFQLYG